MAKKEDGKSHADLEGEVLSAIAAFEQILEAMPHDRSSLEALSHAYGQIGDHAKAGEYLIRLGQVLLDEHDLKAAQGLVDKLAGYAEDDPRAKSIMDRIGKMVQSPAGEHSAVKAGQVESAACESLLKGFDMSDEMSFAWNLMESKKISEEEYASIVQDLTEMSTGEAASTVSVMHVLDARGSKSLEKILAFVSSECKTPIISFSSFDLQGDTILLLPLEVMLRRGVVVFELIGSDALVVMMNPYNKKLQKDVTTALGRHCHFYTTTPAEFDQAVQKAAEIIEERKEAEEEAQK